jgi:hypothetical protein
LRLLEALACCIRVDEFFRKFLATIYVAYKKRAIVFSICMHGFDTECEEMLWKYYEQKRIILRGSSMLQWSDVVGLKFKWGRTAGNRRNLRIGYLCSADNAFHRHKKKWRTLSKQSSSYSR